MDLCNNLNPINPRLCTVCFRKPDLQDQSIYLNNVSSALVHTQNYQQNHANIHPNSFKSSALEENLEKRKYSRRKKFLLSKLEELNLDKHQYKYKFLVLDKTTKKFLYWDLLNGALTLFFIFEIPLVAFFPFEMHHTHETIYIRVLTAITIVVFFVDIIFTFNTSIHVKGCFLQKRKEIALQYLKEKFYLDLFPIGCLFLQLIYFRQYIYYSFIFYIRGYRIFRIQEDLLHSLRLKKTGLALCSFGYLMLWMVFLVHLFGCIFYGVAYNNNQINPHQDSWLTVSGLQNNIIDLPLATQYLYCFYWSLTTMITVGYGDISPKNAPEVIVSVATMVVSYILFAYMFNAIWEVISTLHETNFNYQKNMTCLNGFMTNHQVPLNLQKRIIAFLAQQKEGNVDRDIDAEEGILQTLSNNLKEELIYETKGLMLQQCPFFSNNFGKKFLSKLSCEIEEEHFSRGDIIFSVIIQQQSKQHDRQFDDFSVYYIISGVVEVYINKTEDVDSYYKLCTLIKKQYFGLFAFVTGCERTASIKCLEDSVVYKISRQKCLDTLELFPKEKYKFMMIKDEVIYSNKYARLGLQCFSCGSHYHLAQDCDQTHFKFNMEEEYNRVNSRTKYLRLNNRMKRYYFDQIQSQKIDQSTKDKRQSQNFDKKQKSSDDNFFVCMDNYPKIIRLNSDTPLWDN